MGRPPIGPWISQCSCGVIYCALTLEILAEVKSQHIKEEHSSATTHVFSVDSPANP